MRGQLKTISIFAAFVAGALLPQAAGLKFLVRYMLMFMIFTSLLQTRFSKESLTPSHFLLFLVNLLFGLGGWLLFRAAGAPTLAMAAFFTAITPTAVAAPVVTGLLGGRVDFVVNSFLITNLGMALCFPVLIPVVIGDPAPGVFLSVINNIAVVIGIPLAAAMLLRKAYPASAAWPGRLKNVTFYMWVATIFLIIANASAFIRHHGNGVSLFTLSALALLSLVICALNFRGGALLGGTGFRRECSQSLGQKNTTLTIYLALVYANPLVSLAPTFYVIWHNAWNAIQLQRMSKNGGK